MTDATRTTLPTRQGERPRTSGPMPNIQLDQLGSPVLQATLMERIYALPDHDGMDVALATAEASGTASAGSEYQPGVCNIGPPEIARRRRAGHVGLVATIAVLGALIAIDAPPVARLVVALPAAASASGYLQARLRFCAGFGSRGVFNFGELGPTEQVLDPVARVRDRARANRIGLASLAIGVTAGILVAVLPL